MTYILDTHFVIWAVVQPNFLSANVRDIISDLSNRIVVSTISFWEISLKESIGKLQLVNYVPEDFAEASKKMGFETMPLSADDASTFHHLTGNYHKAPFRPDAYLASHQQRLYHY